MRSISSRHCRRARRSTSSRIPAVDWWASSCAARCLALAERPHPAQPGTVGTWVPSGPMSSRCSAPMTTLLPELNQALEGRALRICAFRARCLAQPWARRWLRERLDRWLSVIGSVASKALPQSPIAEVANGVGDFIAAVVKERTDPKTLPGIEAMMPESTFIRLMNWPSARGAGELYVIAGDIDPNSILGQAARLGHGSFLQRRPRPGRQHGVDVRRSPACRPGQR